MRFENIWNRVLFYLPSFQRDFVWDNDDIKDFIHSMIDGRPIGSIILSSPQKQDPKDLDPFSISLTGEENKSSTEFYYIIDGQQRLTSLWLLFNNWTIEKRKINRGPFYFDRGEREKYVTRRNRGIPLTILVKGFILNDYEAKNRLGDLLQTKDEWNKLNEKFKNLEDYKIPFYVIKTVSENENTFRDMANTFIKINKAGVRIGGIELTLSYLAGTIKEANWRDMISPLVKELEAYGIKFEPIVRFIFSNFGLTQSQITKVDEFRNNIEAIRGKKIGDILSASQNTLRLVVQFLREKLKIISASVFPSQLPIIPIATFFHEKKISDLKALKENDAVAINNWLFLANFNGYYTSSPDSKLDEDLDIVKKADTFPMEKLFQNMEARKVRVKLDEEIIRRGLDKDAIRSQGKAYLFLLYLLLIKNEADDWTGAAITGRNWDDLAKHHIFPREYLLSNQIVEEGKEDAELRISNLGNITLINSSKNEEIRADPPIKYIGEKVREDQAQKHFIPTDKSVLEKYEVFLAKRLDLICDAAKRYLSQLF